MMKAPSVIIINDTSRFVDPFDPAYRTEAQTIGDQLGLPVRSDMLAYTRALSAFRRHTASTTVADV